MPNKSISERQLKKITDNNKRGYERKLAKSPSLFKSAYNTLQRGSEELTHKGQRSYINLGIHDWATQDTVANLIRMHSCNVNKGTPYRARSYYQDSNPESDTWIKGGKHHPSHTIKIVIIDKFEKSAASQLGRALRGWFLADGGVAEIDNSIGKIGSHIPKANAKHAAGGAECGDYAQSRYYDQKSKIKRQIKAYKHKKAEAFKKENRIKHLVGTCINETCRRSVKVIITSHLEAKYKGGKAMVYDTRKMDIDLSTELSLVLAHYTEKRKVPSTPFKNEEIKAAAAQLRETYPFKNEQNNTDENGPSIQITPV